MKFDSSKLQDLIKDKLRENVDVFENFETGRSFECTSSLKKFVEDNTQSTFSS